MHAVWALAADLQSIPAYSYTNDENYVSQIEEEAELVRKLGLPASLHRGDIGLPFEVLVALRFDQQAQFHPVRYVTALAATIPGDGSHVFEQSRATDWDSTRVQTAKEQ